MSTSLTEDDCTEGRQFDDQIGCFGFIDNSEHFVREAGAYGIPYRSLLPRGLDNVLVAGRMTSVDTVAHNSTRNTVCCLVSGQAAGTAAALAAQRWHAAVSGRCPGTPGRAAKAAGVLLEPRPDPIP